MNEKSYYNWHSYSDKALSELIGGFVKHHRIQQQLSQQEVADKANISRSTLSLLERGESVTLTTLLQVLRILNLLYVLEVFKVQKILSPIALAKAERSERKRVYKNTNLNTKKNSEW